MQYFLRFACDLNLIQLNLISSNTTHVYQPKVITINQKITPNLKPLNKDTTIVCHGQLGHCPELRVASLGLVATYTYSTTISFSRASMPMESIQPPLHPTLFLFSTP
jgi:hypothetical protein